MCGIIGIVEKHADRSELMDRMLDVLAHRGPDAKSMFRHKDTILGHRRLSIIDLETGDQPMFNASRTRCIVFNGEIYNFREIRQELEAMGRRFRTNSDTEVLLEAYEVFGLDFLARLNGIFAFALYDLEKEELLLVRDHFGIKPLHYYSRDGLFLFGSEQKTILQHPEVPRALNYRALHHQLNLRYTQGEETLFEGIKRLPPAHYLVYRDGAIQSLKPYWRLQPSPRQNMDEGEAMEQLHVHLRQAVERQLVSDVPLGVYLSGGLDSSAIVQKMHELGVPQINTFTLGFNEPTDEFPDARRVAEHFGTHHQELSLTLNPLEEFPKVIWHAEEPKINLLQGFNMSRFVQPQIKVALGGLGGDELLAGYDIHRFVYPFNRVHHLIPEPLQRLLQWKSDFVFQVQTSVNGLPYDEYRRGVQLLLSIGQIERFYLILRNVWDVDPGFYREVYHPRLRKAMQKDIPRVEAQFHELFAQVKHLNALDQVLFVEAQSKMVNDYLLVEDRMSMAHSIEERVPFLDLDLVHFGFSIPVGLKIKHNQTKYLFRKAMAPHLPPRIISKKKWGFTVNPYQQFKKDLKTVAERLLTPEFVDRQGIFNYAYLRRIMNHPPHPRMRWHYNFLWVAVGLAIWEKMFLDPTFDGKDFSMERFY
ncbi:MAG: asparagine synthase (glutamine-hydrolyzing) [Haliscomenobacter sp.]|nr:asparagine synthase (glutamine-hydrolyzing) [Haliscomenobacter sp.]